MAGPPSPGLPLLFDSDPLAPNYQLDDAAWGTEAQGLGLDLNLPPPPPPQLPPLTPADSLAAAATSLRGTVEEELEDKRAVAREKNRLAQRRHR